MRKTKAVEDTVAYTTRHLPTRHLDHMRELAALQRMNIEEVLIAALDIGLPIMDSEWRKERRLKRLLVAGGKSK